jgi:hypothetical protein
MAAFRAAIVVFANFGITLYRVRGTRYGVITSIVRLIQSSSDDLNFR